MYPKCMFRWTAQPLLQSWKGEMKIHIHCRSQTDNNRMVPIFSDLMVVAQAAGNNNLRLQGKEPYQPDP